MRLTDAEAFEQFKQIRWSANGGEPFCQRCGCVAVYSYKPPEFSNARVAMLSSL